MSQSPLPSSFHLTLTTLPRHPTSTLFPYPPLFRSRISPCWIAPTSAPHLRPLPPPPRRPAPRPGRRGRQRSEEHTSELQTRRRLVCCLLLEKKKISPSREPGNALYVRP